MVKQYTENQYDDDLTVGTDDYDDSYYTGSVDLFEFSSDEESPISRLKSLILSIDWEITDEVLMQFNEELVDLRNIWSGEKINLVYVQALEKISKYIYQKKADSHPSAIKLLLTLYHNLEKIVSSFDLSEEQKKEILLEDVKRFESLKHYISKQTSTIEETKPVQPNVQKETGPIFTEIDLLNLKAIVLGIDWEITDQDLNELRQEVIRLEKKFADSRPRLIFLQGIGTLAAYIKLKKGNAHADAFKLLHLFYESLEKIVITPMSLAEEKAILFPAVEKFNAFKVLLGATIAPEAINRHENEADEEYNPADSVVIAPAFADIPEDETIGFQAEEEAKSLGFESAESVDDHVESFFMGTGFQQAESPSLDDVEHGTNTDRESVLQGVDVEMEFEENVNDIIPPESDRAPALSMASQEKLEGEQPSNALEGSGLEVDEEPVDLEDGVGLPAETFEDTFVDSYFAEVEAEKAEPEFSKLDRDVVLQGVDVETEADDDSDEEALPLLGGELAPALEGNDEVSIFHAEIFEDSPEAQNIDEEIAGTLGGFFDEEIESHLSISTALEDVDPEVQSDPVDASEDSIEIGGYDDTQFPAETNPAIPENWEEEERIEEDIFASFAFEETAFPEDQIIPTIDGDQPGVVDEPDSESEPEPEMDFDSELELETEPESGTEIEAGDAAIAFVSKLEEEENLSDIFGEGDFETNMEDSLADEQEEEFSEIDDQLDSFFDLEKDVEEPEEDKLLFTQPQEPGISTDEEIVSTASVIPDIEDDDTQEDEVVFELVEEVEQLTDSDPLVEESEEETSLADLSAAGEDADSSDLIIETKEENSEALSKIIAPAFDADMTADAYGTLRVCVESLGVELDDKIILGLWEEIDQLHHNLIDKPLEKTFLQLLSTIMRHIDQNRYDSSADAYVLLQSVSDALSKLQAKDLCQNQELLLTETHKVLQWQENLLAQQAARKEAELTIGDASNDQDENQGDFAELLQKDNGEATVERNDSNDQDAAAEEVKNRRFDQEETSQDSRSLNRKNQEFSVEIDNKINAGDLKQEISNLRQTLQDEIAELRKELKSNYL